MEKHDLTLSPSQAVQALYLHKNKELDGQLRKQLNKSNRVLSMFCYHQIQRKAQNSYHPLLLQLSNVDN